MNNFSNFVPVAGSIIPLEFPTFYKWALSLHDHFIPHERNNYHPHVLSHRMLALLSILVVTVKIVGVSLVAFTPATTSYAAPITIENVVSLANKDRVANGLGELKTSSLLSRAAQNKANDMLARQYFAHNTPDGQTPWTFIKAVGYSYTTAGENLAIDFTQAENIQTAWMNSPGHRANILNNNFTEIGIGISNGMFDGHETTIVVQMFGNPLNAPVTLQETPTKVIEPAPAVPVPTAPTPAVQTPAPVQSIPSEVTSNELQNQPTEVNAPITEGGEALEIIDTKTSLQGNQLYLEVTATHNAVKLLAFWGARSLILDPIADGLWKGTIPLAEVSPQDSLMIQVQDLDGQMHQQPVAQFSNQLASLNAGEVEGAQVSLFGTSFNVNIWEEKIFLVILAGLIAALILAIAIKRHVQHVSLVANTSFAAMLIAMLLIL